MKHFIALLLALSFSGILTAQPNLRSRILPQFAPFYHGVVSGDPTDSSVILWTRITPDTLGQVLTAHWVIALDTGLTSVVQSGTVSTDSSKDYCVKLDVTGLSPLTWYYFRFDMNGRNSLIGRTLTAPSGVVDTVRLGMADCAEYTNGYFNAYGALALRNDLHGILHLGDYIYESGGGSGNFLMNPDYEILSRSDYRTRHSHYKLDPDLRRLHQMYPFITVYDDHETCNNSWMHGALNHDPATDGDWEARKENGMHAYREWMAVRYPDPNDSSRIWRNFTYGDLIDLWMLDTRLWARDSQVTGSAVNDPSRNLIGPQQLNWLSQGMKNSNAKWQMLGQQVMVAPLSIPFVGPFNTDQWDGYTAERQRLYDTVVTYNIRNMVVLTGDIHSAWANDLPLAHYNASTGDSSAGVEFVGTSITSQGLPLGVPLSIVQNANPHIKYANLTDHGYMVIDVNKSRVQGEWWYVDNINTQYSYGDSLQSIWYVNDQERHLRQGSTASVPPASAWAIPPPPLPANPPVSNEAELKPVILGLWPNPASDKVVVQFGNQKAGPAEMQLQDLNGKILWSRSWEYLDQEVREEEISLKALPAGTYMLRLHSNGNQASWKVIRME